MSANSPSGRWKMCKVSVARTCCSKVDQSVRSCASVSRASTSAIFATGRWENCKVSVARTNCSKVDQSVRSFANVSRASTSAVFPSGRWENFSCGTYILKLTEASAADVQAESRQARQQFSHPGDGNFRRSLRHAPPVVDRSVVCSCASVIQGKHVSNFPIGVMEVCRRGWDTYLGSCVGVDLGVHD